MQFPKTFGIYLITNLINGKIYIGKTNNLNRRASEYRYVHKEYKNQGKSLIFDAIRKYGWENFSFAVLVEFPYIENDLLLEIEAIYIKKYKVLDKTIGYNIVEKGTGVLGLKHTQEAKNKMRIGHLGKSPANKGVPMSEEQKKKLSEIAKAKGIKGDKHPMFGKSRSFETIAKLKATKAANPQDHSYCMKSVKQIDKNTGEVINIFKSISEAAKFVGAKNTGAIVMCCNKKPDNRGYYTKSSMGFKWEYTDKESAPINLVSK